MSETPSPTIAAGLLLNVVDSLALPWPRLVVRFLLVTRVLNDLFYHGSLGVSRGR